MRPAALCWPTLSEVPDLAPADMKALAMEHMGNGGAKNLSWVPDYSEESPGWRGGGMYTVVLKRRLRQKTRLLSCARAAGQQDVVLESAMNPEAQVRLKTMRSWT